MILYKIGSDVNCESIHLKHCIDYAGTSKATTEPIVLMQWSKADIFTGESGDWIEIAILFTFPA